MSAKYTFILVVIKEVFHETEGVPIYKIQEKLIADLWEKWVNFLLDWICIELEKFFEQIDNTILLFCF